MMAMISRDDFAACEKSEFTFSSESTGSFVALLESVTETRVSGRSESFALLFTAPPDTPDHQQTYRAEHATLGSLDLFLVPVGKDETSVRFESVFNHLGE